MRVTNITANVIICLILNSIPTEAVDLVMTYRQMLYLIHSLQKMIQEAENIWVFHMYGAVIPPSGFDCPVL